MKDIGAVLELFRASEIIIHPDEFVLEKQNFLTSHFLIQESSNGSIHAYGWNKYVGLQVVSSNKTLFTNSVMLDCMNMEYGDFNSAK